MEMEKGIWELEKNPDSMEDLGQPCPAPPPPQTTRSYPPGTPAAPTAGAQCRRPTTHETRLVIADLWTVPSHYPAHAQRNIVHAQEDVREVAADAADAAIWAAQEGFEPEDEDEDGIDADVRYALFELIMVQRHYARTLGRTADGGYDRPSAFIARSGVFMTPETPVREFDSGCYDIVVAVKREPAREIVPQWFVFLVDLHGLNPTTAKCRSYTVRPAGTRRWERVVEDDDNVDDNNRFAGYAVLEKLPKDKWDEFEALFNGLELGPNNFFIARLFAKILEAGIARDLERAKLEGLVRSSNHSDVEFEGTRTNRRANGYLECDLRLFEVFGEDALTVTRRQRRSARPERGEDEDRSQRGRSASPERESA
ncbi:hypothetical protein BDW74DRAFT_175896 [Aspergillus multicolor]|uniref:uncharacterized protein n=1 Tax=Aspergillus multicolor TaxID=41759 RepID=UPI003CCDD28F